MMKKYIFLVANVLIALIFMVFGANKILTFMDMPQPTDPAVIAFMAGVFGSYLGMLVGITEFIGGLMLLFPRTKFLGTLVLIPILLNIILFHICVEKHVEPMTIAIFVFFSVLCYSQKAGFKKLFKIESK